jgi:eukaryotic-like serine/threonine-protein kinase
VAVSPLSPGAVVGRRYRLERMLTQGGMGVVWTATHLVTKRRVAIKLLRAGGHDDAGSRARLLREARASCAVDHPSVLPVLDVLEVDGAPALVMELLEGESLRERLERKGALGVRETCAILAPVAEALGAAHAARIVHRDVKPENIFLVGGDAQLTVKVLDFGIAKIVATEEPASSLTETGAMLGTPYYMAPEQAFGERDVGPAADAWALGIVVYECLSGARPTQAENLGQVIKRITREPMAPIEESVAGVPPDLASLVGRLLDRDAGAREVDMSRVARILASRAVSVAVEAKPRRKALVPLALLAGVAGTLALGLAWRGASPPRAEMSTPVASASPLAAAASSLVVASSAPSGAPVASVVVLGDTAPRASASVAASASVPGSRALPLLPVSRAIAAAAPASGARASPPLDAGRAAVAGDAATPTGPGRVIVTSPF